MAFRDRFFTPRVAQAIMAPSSILVAGGAAAAAILAVGLGPLAVVAGLGAYAGKVALAIPRGAPSPDRIDPFQVGDPWRRFVMDAQKAERRFGETVRRARSGPVRDRLATIDERMKDAVRECWQIARQGDQLDGALRTLDVRSIRLELEEIHEERRRQRHDEKADASLYRAQQAVESQLASADRLAAVARDAQNRLRVLNAQLDEAVARSVEISVSASDASQLSPLTDEVDNVVGELEALRQGLEEVSAVAGGTPRTSPGGTA